MWVTLGSTAGGASVLHMILDVLNMVDQDVIHLSHLTFSWFEDSYVFSYNNAQLFGREETRLVGSFTFAQPTESLRTYAGVSIEFKCAKSLTHECTRALLGLVRTLPSAGGGGRIGPPIYLGNQQT